MDNFNNIFIFFNIFIFIFLIFFFFLLPLTSDRPLAMIGPADLDWARVGVDCYRRGPTKQGWVSARVPLTRSGKADPHPSHDSLVGCRLGPNQAIRYNRWDTLGAVPNENSSTEWEDCPTCLISWRRKLHLCIFLTWMHGQGSHNDFFTEEFINITKLQCSVGIVTNFGIIYRLVSNELGTIPLRATRV